MALKSRKSILGDLRKLFSNEKEPDVPPLPRNPSIDIPVNALRISRYGAAQNLQITFYRKSDKKFFIGDNHYYVPRCMQPPGTTDLDPAIRRFTWVFKREFAPKSTPAKLHSFMGSYSIWYKDDPGTSAGPKTLAKVDGDFWMMKHVQKGDTVEWGHIPTDMLAELRDDWWFTGVQLPDIDAVCAEVAAARARERQLEASP